MNRPDHVYLNDVFNLDVIQNGGGDKQYANKHEAIATGARKRCT